MNDPDRLVEFLENSFLSPLLEKRNITDISFNGEEIYYDDRDHDHRLSSIRIDNEAVGAFLRQLANMAEKQFSYMSPNLDIHFGKYRLNAMFKSICRVYERPAYSFSLRLGSEGSAVSDNPSFFPSGTKEILLRAIKRRESIVIAGDTGSGKTELQKYLLLHLPEATRVIVIDNVGELELCRGEQRIDLTFWLADDRYEDATYAALIRDALRNNPHYLILAEARGAEMVEALSAAMSGHPLITTLHAKDLEAVPFRMARMAQGLAGKDGYEDVLADIYHHFSLIVYLGKKKTDGMVCRYIHSIGRLKEKEREIEILYRSQEKEDED